MTPLHILVFKTINDQQPEQFPGMFAEVAMMARWGAAG
jgi:hypothetical protein